MVKGPPYLPSTDGDSVCVDIVIANVPLWEIARVAPRSIKRISITSKLLDGISFDWVLCGLVHNLQRRINWTTTLCEDCMQFSISRTRMNQRHVGQSW